MRCQHEIERGGDKVQIQPSVTAIHVLIELDHLVPGCHCCSLLTAV